MTRCAHCNRLISDDAASYGARIAGKRCERCEGTGILSGCHSEMCPPEFRDIIPCHHCDGHGRIAVEGAGTICPTCAVCERAAKEEGSESDARRGD